MKELTIKIVIIILSFILLIVVVYVIWKYCLRHRFKKQDCVENSDCQPPGSPHRSPSAKPIITSDSSPQLRSRERRLSHQSNPSSILHLPLEIIKEEDFQQSSEESGNNRMKGLLHLGFQQHGIQKHPRRLNENFSSHYNNKGQSS